MLFALPTLRHASLFFIPSAISAWFVVCFSVFSLGAYISVWAFDIAFALRSFHWLGLL
jgi:hypothetical protein